jgi:transposase InsO family protein
MDTWPLFKLRTEMARQELNLMFLTTDQETTLTTTEPSKKFTKALHAVVPHTAMADFLGSQRNLYRTRRIKMYQRLRTIHEPTHAGAITAILDQFTNFIMGTTETFSMYELCIKLLNEWFPREIAYTLALLAHTVYKGLDKSRYSEFQANVRAGN